MAPDEALTVAFPEGIAHVVLGPGARRLKRQLLDAMERSDGVVVEPSDVALREPATREALVWLDRLLAARGQRLVLLARTAALSALRSSEDLAGLPVRTGLADALELARETSV
jgi:hypothetical protein